MADDDDDDNYDNYDNDKLEDEEEEDENDDSITENHKSSIKKIHGKDRKTIPRLTSYEKARIIGTRSLQIENGSFANIVVENITESTSIAQKELEENKTPLYIGRPLGDGNSMEIWHSNELVQIDVGLSKMKTSPFQQIGNLSLKEILNFGGVLPELRN